MSHSMNKFWGIVYNMIDNSDVTLEVIDARLPSICRSNQLEKYVNAHPQTNLLIALNKSDLVPREHTDAWLDWFRAKGFYAVAVSAKKRLGTQILRKSILMTSKRKTALAAVVGLPNTGKSSLINALRGKSAAATAPIPGKTRGEQKVKVSNSIRMFDTPGVVPVKLPEKHNLLLGLTAITRIRDLEAAAMEFYEIANQLSPGVIEEYYGIDEEDILEGIARKRNKIRKGGVPDVHEAARILLSDHVAGKFVIVESVERPLRMMY